jgi:Na+/phosphate symporter
MFEHLFGSKEGSPLVKAAFEDISGMMQQSAKMLDLALSALLDNVEIDADLDHMDDVVDDGERMVRRTILEHLSINPQQDLVASLILVSMVQDVERIGDFARGLGELVSLAKSPREGRFRDDLAAYAERIRPLFALCEEAFREDDAELARQVVVSHNELKAEILAFTAAIADSDLSADMVIVYASSARMLRRISAHLCNIASTVVQPFDRMRHGDEQV